MATFLTDRIKTGYTQKEVLDVLFESEQEKECRRILAIVNKTVNALRLQKMKYFLAYEKLATWRRMNGFDRVVEGEEPTISEQYAASSRLDLKKLKDAISMPAESSTVTRPRQKTMDVVDGRRSDFLDELLANFEFARIKEYVDKRSREAAQAQVTVTPVDTVQHCGPCPPDPEPSSSVYVKLENTEGKMGPELEELEPPSAGTGLEAPGQQCPPNEGIWETGRTTAPGILTTGMVSSKKENISSPTEREKSTATVAGISSTAATPSKCRHKTSSEQNKQFDPGGKGEKAPPWNAAVTLLSFSGESWEDLCLFSVCALSLFCVCSVS